MLRTLAALILMVPAAATAAAAQCPDGTPPPCGPAQQRVPRIQVLGFSAGGGDTALAYVADALTDDVVASLRSAGGVIVLSARASRAAADYQLSGRVSGSGNGVSVSARLERADGRVAWTASRERMRRDLPAMAGELSSELLQSIGLRAPAVRAARPVDPQLYDLVLRGRYQVARRTPASIARSAVLFRQAIALDSSSALGWSWLARALFIARRFNYPVPGIPAESTLAAMLASADRAIELDPSNANVWVMRAHVAQDIIPNSRTSAIAALRRAIALDPGLPDAWRWLGLLLQEVGDTTEAVAAMSRAVAIAPDEGEWLANLGLHYVWHRDYATARRWADSAVAVDPMLPLARSVAAQAAFWQGQLDQAEGHVSAVVRLGQPDLIGDGVDVRLLLERGDSGAARATLATLRERAGPEPSIHQTIAIANGLVALGDTAQALDVLERFPVRGEMHFQLHLRLERGLDALHALPRFQSVLVTPRN